MDGVNTKTLRPTTVAFLALHCRWSIEQLTAPKSVFRPSVHFEFLEKIFALLVKFLFADLPSGVALFQNLQG